MKLIKKAFAGIVLPILFGVSLPNNILAQKVDPPIAEAEKTEIINQAMKILKEKYIFPEKVSPMEKAVYKKFSEGQYAQYTTTNKFLKQLNHDMETLIEDRHVNIFYDPIKVKQIKAENKGTYTHPNFSPEFLKRAKFENHMVRKAERLDGNIGYLKLDLFLDSRIAKPTIVSGMNFLSNSDIMIIDIRQNGGGNANAVNFLTNYFLPDSTLISEYYSTLTKETTKTYIEHEEQVQKFSDKVPLYILVSKKTSSAAEAFAYQLQAFKRAIVIGDTTLGEANPGYAFALNDNLWLMVPTSINSNAVTKTNWQGIGVIPDILIKSGRALEAALADAYKKLSSNPENAKIKYLYEWLSFGFAAKANPIPASEKQLQAFVGKYEHNRNIILEHQNLFYQRAGTGEKKKLIPLAENLFELDGSAYFRVRFIKNLKGETVALEGLYDDGDKEVSKKLDLAD